MPLTALRTLTPPALPSALPPLTLTLIPNLPTATAAPTPNLSAAELQKLSPPLTFTITASTPNPAPYTAAAPRGGVTLTLSLPDGRQIQAQSPIPLPLGTSVQVAPPTPPVTEPQPFNTNNAAAPLVLRTIAITLPNAPTTTLAGASATMPALSALATPPVTPNLNANLPANLTPNLTVLSLTSLVPQISPLQTYAAQTPIPGPMTLQPATPLPANWQGQTLNLTLNTPTSGTLRISPSASASPPSTQTVKMTLPESINLPLKQSIPILIGSGIPQMQKSMVSSTPLVALILPTTSKPLTPSNPNLSFSGAPLAPTASTLFNHLRVLLPSGTPPGTYTARVLAPTPATPALQPLLLPNGQVAHIELLAQAPSATFRTQPPTVPTPPSLPSPLPTGSVVVVNIPTLTGPAQILQLHSQQPQLLPQPNATAAATPPQTPQAVLATGTVVTGTIVGQNASGQPLLTLTNTGPLAGQTFALTLQNGSQSGAPLAATLVVGAKVQIGIEPSGNATLLALTLPQAAARATALASLGSQWPALQNILNALQGHNPALAAQARANLPQIANLLPGLTRLLQSLPGADTAKLLGAEAARTAQALGGTLAPDLAQLQTLTQRPEDGGWRGIIFPYCENPEGNPKQGSFFWRREKKADPRAPTSTRFVAELELSTLGPLQLDGLLTYPTLWLKLRSQRPLPEGLSQALQQFIAPLLTSLSLEGGISTESALTFPLHPAAQIRAQAEEALGVAE